MNTKINFKFLSTLEDPGRAIEWCMKAGLIADCYECPKCGKQMKLMKRVDVKNGQQWRCTDVSHDVRRSLKKNSLFDKSNLTMHQILMIVYMWCLKLPSESITNDLGITGETVVKWKIFCKEVCVNACVRTNEMIGGNGVIVEIDESKFGKSKNPRGKWVEGKWVFGGVERGTKKCFMAVVKERNKDTLLNVIRMYVRPGSTVISYCWKTYNCLDDEGYRVLTLNHKLNFKHPESAPLSVEGTWNNIKRKMGTKYKKGEFDTYLYEYLWRWQNSNCKKELINNFLKAVVELYPPATKDE